MFFSKTKSAINENELHTEDIMRHFAYGKIQGCPISHLRMPNDGGCNSASCVFLGGACIPAGPVDLCYTCKKPYYGGDYACAAAGGGGNFDPTELMCGGCSPINAEDCVKHGKDYLEFKCRYCCSVVRACFSVFSPLLFCTNENVRADFVRFRTTTPLCELCRNNSKKIHKFRNRLFMNI